MEHVVFYPALDGAPAFRRFASLDDAVRFVEHLRNAEGVSEVSVHALAPVPLSFRAYYKVEVPQESEAAPVADAAPVTEVAEIAEVAEIPAPSEPVYDMAEVPAVQEPAEPVMAPVEPEPVPVMVSPNGKKSLGFFAH
jgi:hypothetical protein